MKNSKTVYGVSVMIVANDKTQAIAIEAAIKKALKNFKIKGQEEIEIQEWS